MTAKGLELMEEEMDREWRTEWSSGRKWRRSRGAQTNGRCQEAEEGGQCKWEKRLSRSQRNGVKGRNLGEFEIMKLMEDL